MELINNIVQERNVSREEVFSILELAIQKASRQKYGFERNIQVDIDRETGLFSLHSFYEVVSSQSVNKFKQISISEAKKVDFSCEIGGVVKIPLICSDLGRVAAQVARKIIGKRIREMECVHQYSEFKDRVGDIVSGLVKRIEFDGYIVDIFRTECFLSKKHVIFDEIFNVGDCVCACIIDVKSSFYGFQVFLSRTSFRFVFMLFKREISEISDGSIEIRAISRIAGYRSKVSVFSDDKIIDPVRVCLGFKGSRIRNIISEIRGERIDVVLWSSDSSAFISNSLFPVNVIKVLFCEGNNVDVVIEDSKLSLAIGYRGQNVHLVTMLTGYNINIISESSYMNKKTTLLSERISTFVDVFDISDVVAHFLVNSGFKSVGQIAASSIEDLKLNLAELDCDLIILIKERAVLFLKGE